MTTKISLGVIAVVVLGLAIYGAYLYPKAENSVGSSAGATFSTAKVAAVVMAPNTQAATSSSIVNTDGSGRWVTDAFAYCSGDSTAFTNITGGGLAALTLQAATTSTSGAGLLGNTNYAANMTLATSSTYAANSTTTPTGSPDAKFYYWGSGVDMTFLFNATTTATAACTVGVHYLPS